MRSLLMSGLLGAAAVALPPQRSNAEPSTIEPSPSSTDSASATELPEDSNTAEARRLFQEGAALVVRAQWSEALAAFERSAKRRRHAVTIYNAGACLRAMGRYVQARKRFAEALREHERAGGKQLSESLLEEASGYVGQIDDLLARLRIDLDPPTASIAVDGRPLEPTLEAGSRPVLLAGTLPPGHGKPPPRASFDVLLDPGAHVITLSRKGFRDALLNRTLLPGTVTELQLRIDRLPATLAINADVEQARVQVDDVDVGLAPVEVSRPGGSYLVRVERDGFVPYETTAVVDPGERLRIRATLLEEGPALYEQWWFWPTLGVVLAGAVVVTYFAARPEPERPAPNGGGLGWVIEVP